MNGANLSCLSGDRTFFVTPAPRTRTDSACRTLSLYLECGGLPNFLQIRLQQRDRPMRSIRNWTVHHRQHNQQTLSTAATLAAAMFPQKLGQ